MGPGRPVGQREGHPALARDQAEVAQRHAAVVLHEPPGVVARRPAEPAADEGELGPRVLEPERSARPRRRAQGPRPRGIGLEAGREGAPRRLAVETRLLVKRRPRDAERAVVDRAEKSVGLPPGQLGEPRASSGWAWRRRIRPGKREPQEHEGARVRVRDQVGRVGHGLGARNEAGRWRWSRPEMAPKGTPAACGPRSPGSRSSASLGRAARGWARCARSIQSRTSAAIRAIQDAVSGTSLGSPVVPLVVANADDRLPA